MLNRVLIMGRLGRDPDLRYTPTGVAVANFSLAVDRDFKDKNSGERETDWIDVVAWRQTAEFAAQYLKKGRTAVVDGRLQVRAYQDKEGNSRRTTEVVAEHIYFGDSRRDDTGGTKPSGQYGARPDYSGQYAPPADGFGDIPDDKDMPF